MVSLVENGTAMVMCALLVLADARSDPFKVYQTLPKSGGSRLPSFSCDSNMALAASALAEDILTLWFCPARCRFPTLVHCVLKSRPGSLERS